MDQVRIDTVALARSVGRPLTDLVQPEVAVLEALRYHLYLTLPYRSLTAFASALEV